MNDEAVNTGLYMGKELGGGNFSTKNVIEDFMKTEYQEGLRNEFNTMDALINKLPKDTISGKVKYKAFALGISDNVRAVGSGTYDRYELGFDDFYGKGVDTVEAQFDTTKLMATFAITDEAILKGTGDGSLIDVLKDSLSRMEIGLKHTYNRFIYGGHDGIIGKVKSDISVFSLDGVTATAKIDRERDNRGKYHNQFDYQTPVKMVAFSFTNSHSLIEGMGCMVEIKTLSESVVTAAKRYIGRIFQKDNTKIHSEKVIMVVEAVATATVSGGEITGWTVKKQGEDGFSVTAVTYAASTSDITVYSRQLSDSRLGTAEEYHGLEDIIIRSDAEDDNAKIFGVDRRVYTSLRCTTVDLEDSVYLNEEILRDLSDHLALSSPDGTAISLVCANHRIISMVEKSLYQFKNYNLTNVGQGMQLGGSYELRFDNYVLYKDKYARDNNLYMLDQAKIGELVRRDFTWITSGEVNGVLQRRPGTEMYEGIMNKYADMYIDAWRCHAAIKNCKVPSTGIHDYLSYNSDGSPIGVLSAEVENNG